MYELTIRVIIRNRLAQDAFGRQHDEPRVMRRCMERREVDLSRVSRFFYVISTPRHFASLLFFSCTSHNKGVILSTILYHDAFDCCGSMLCLLSCKPRYTRFRWPQGKQAQQWKT